MSVHRFNRKELNMKFVSVLLTLSLLLGILPPMIQPVRAAGEKYIFSSGAVVLDESFSNSNVIIENGVFSVTVDELLSEEAVPGVAEEDQGRNSHFRDLFWGLLDCGIAILLFLPLWGQQKSGNIQAVSLLALTGVQPWLKASCFAVIVATVVVGISELALQTCTTPFWLRKKAQISLSVHTAGILLFILSRQPYAAALSFLLLMVKLLILARNKG